ncbi:UDP-4-amino-4,6-dideoxy-N-acetyl-beta-L-altrosamine N-acetyltransferase [Alteromonas sediminis]|uniref:UDP-4-amino-4, 6-dideoxy-N-acetyl-beta-L-altrosamine N-acetyltransferase n=1 Tax=Alteromonas sediminis TaxID=2259342 RepID=A0A3N5Z7W2_9ALTE|nr:UDP-4-amino-4,6-dideoxy-N-acetyl-beta-L-altrosamine N-acetyltransferase [Alteromonas sediminis]RPJ64978.1 UDP-4-amino-4,6-dideoxy-N-acetyl-beta-L-altrosamine N-acetyltransferase [Alteromonas sediminis]
MFRFRRMTKSDLVKVMHWRLNESVSQFMQTEIKNDIGKQKQWFQHISNDPSFVYWVIEYKQAPVGALNLADIDLKKNECSWGFYIGEPSCRNLGGLIPPYLYNHLFRQCRIEMLKADVMDNNHLVKKLHGLHGYRYKGTVGSDIIKGDESIPLCRFTLAKHDWLAKKRFAKFNAQFENTPQTLLL